MKDAVVVTASGAEVIPFIKVWVMLPMAVVMTILFTKLSNRYSQERVVYLMISIFLVCFTLFAFVLYPMRDFLHPNQLADRLELVMPLGFKGLISMFRWTFTGVLCDVGALKLSSSTFYSGALQMKSLVLEKPAAFIVFLESV